MSERTVTLDVREDLRNGREPFSRIMAAVATLGSDEQLRLLAPFEPVPLFRVLENKGFSHTAQPMKSGEWEVVFTRETAAAEVAPVTAETGGEGRGSADLCGAVQVDARGLEPPQPLMKILEAVSFLAANSELRALTDRRPVHLYPHLTERGFTAQTEEQTDGTFLTHIRRA